MDTDSTPDKVCPVCGRVVSQLYMTRPPRCYLCLDKNQRVYVNSRQLVRSLSTQKDYKNCKRYLREIKRDAGCIICGVNIPAVLDFHHLDPSTKVIRIGDRAWPKDILDNELKKCIVICSNHHRLFHSLYTQKATAEDFLDFRETYPNPNPTNKTQITKQPQQSNLKFFPDAIKS